MGTAKADHKAIDNDIHLETDSGNLIKIDPDNDKWCNWLENNSSFKFIAGFGGEDSYRARKEILGGVVYWYAFKKVNNKLHKRYIGKPHEVTHNRLCEVAKTIRDVKVKPDKEDKPVNNSNQIGNAGLQELVNQLVNQVNELANRLDNLENRGGDAPGKKLESLPSEELEARVKELQRVNQKLFDDLGDKDRELQELTIHLQETKIELKAAKNDATLLNQEVQRLTSELANKNSKLSELSNELANKDSQLQELTNQVDNLNSKLGELTNELANKDRELQELKAAIPPAVVPNPQSPLGEDGEDGEDIKESTVLSPQSLITEEAGGEDQGEDVEDSDRPNETPTNNDQLPMTNDQIIQLFGLEGIVKGDLYSIQSLKDAGIFEKLERNQEILSNLDIKFKAGSITPINGILKKLGYMIDKKPNKRDYFVIVG